MRTLYIITLEPIEQRYTKQWHTYWKKEFSKHYDEVISIDGLPQGEITTGRFLDINKTNIWKAQQVQVIAQHFSNKVIKDGDDFIFMDGWHFGITALKYMAQLNMVHVKIFAYWHAGTWDDNDFITQAGLREWAVMNEAGWLTACDGHFVATNYHKELIVNYDMFSGYGEYFKDMIHVVGFPMDWQVEIEKSVSKNSPKKNMVVFPHRLDKEKQPEVFDKLAKQLPEYSWIKTLEKTRSKKDYYNLLNEAKVIFSANIQETFGIGAVEAMMLNVIPIVPNRLSYVEMYPPIFRYNTIEEAKEKIENAIKNYHDKKYRDALRKTKYKIQKMCVDAIPKMARIMLK